MTPETRFTTRLDKLLREAVRNRDHYHCRECPAKGVEVHHIFGRSLAVRFNPEACVLLCVVSHGLWHKVWSRARRRQAAVQWLGEEKYQRLERESRQIIHSPTLEWYAEWETKLKGMK